MKINSIEQNGEVTVVRVSYTGVDDTLKLLLRSDAHHDSINNIVELEKRHLEEVLFTDGYILDFGDIFDAMQGRNDKRRSYDELKEKFKVDAYFNAIVDDAKEFYAPYASRWLLMGKGNHEKSVETHSNIDLTSNLAAPLGIPIGKYCGWVKFKFEKIYDNGDSGCRTSVNLRYHHGNGGNAPVTKGVIDTNRQAVYLPDADIVVNGHNHNAYIVPLSRERITDSDNLYHDYCYYLRTPGYKAQGEWEREKMFAPTPHGAIWATIRIREAKPEIECRTAFG